MNNKRVGILYYGNLETKRSTTPETRRLPTVFKAFEDLGVRAEAIAENFRIDVAWTLAGFAKFDFCS
jgi:hypothetical protein